MILDYCSIPRPQPNLAFGVTALTLAGLYWALLIGIGLFF